MSSFGTDRQETHARALAKRAGFESLEAAIGHFTGQPLVRLDVTPFNSQRASEIITKLEAKLGITPRVPPAAKAGDGSPAVPPSAPDRPRPKFLTARQLRKIATRQEPPPAELDDDARWVLGALNRLAKFEHAARGAVTMPAGINGSDPIRTSHMVAYFGSEATAADAFGVTLATFKKWGDFIPHDRQDWAQEVTAGYVIKPRAA